MARKIRSTFVGATDTNGEKIKITGPWGQLTVSYDYGETDMHDHAVWQYLAVHCASSLLLRDSEGRRRTLTRSGRGYTYTLADGDPRGESLLIP